MILHYANLVVLAGGVDLFLLSSELRGLEMIRGPGWSREGAIGGDGKVTWDYPFVDGLTALADDVRATFDAAGLTKDTTGLHNLIAYSADWSDWMGFQHPGENGQWPHLDQLWGEDNIDVVAFDNYLPLSDWTTGAAGLDATYWSTPKASSWPPDISAMNGLGLTGSPTIYSKPYLKANIEGGEKFAWFYTDGDNPGRGFDPLGTDLQVSLPGGDRLTQSRSPYYPGQQILANKQIRWWWNNSHQAVYDAGDGAGWVPHAPRRAGSRNRNRLPSPNMACRRSTRQPTSPMSPTIRARARVRRLIGRAGIGSRATLFSRPATIRWPRSRSTPSPNIG